MRLCVLRRYIGLKIRKEEIGKRRWAKNQGGGMVVYKCQVLGIRLLLFSSRIVLVVLVNMYVCHYIIKAFMLCIMYLCHFNFSLFNLRSAVTTIDNKIGTSGIRGSV